MILVTGASGQTGRRVISALSKRGAEVRAFVRREEIGDELLTLGAKEIALGDFFQGDGLKAAIDGCAEVIHICPPMNANEADLARRMTDYCLAAGTERLVLYSVLHPLLRGVRHHGLKLDAEQYLIESGQAYTILQPGRYMQHLVPIWNSVMETGVHNMPFNIETRFNLADLGDLAEAAAIVLTEAGHENATYQLAGPESLNQIDMARIITDVTGRDIRAEAKPLEAFRAGAEKAGMPLDRLEQLCLLNQHYDHCGLVGNPNVLLWILGRDPTDFKAFVERDLYRP